MYNLPGEYILTCDPGLSEHSDSTDFEGATSPIINQRKKQKYWKNFRPKPKRDINTPTCSSSYTVTQNSSREIWESQTIRQHGGTLGVKVRKSYKNKTCKTVDGGDQIATIKSKRALTRRKVIPCLSSMFGRTSNNVKQMSIIRENATENVNIDTGCQAARVNGEHKIRKFNRSQPLYAVQPVYAVEGNAHAKPSPFQHTKIVREPLLNRNIVTNEKSNVWSFASSSDDNKSNRFLKHDTYEKSLVKPSKYRPKMSDDVWQEYHRQKERSRRHKHAEEKCSIEFNRNYEVFTYPCLNQSNAGSCQMGSNPIRSTNEPPLSCSAFWEYILNKLNEQQNQPNKRSKACSCRICDKSLCTNDYSQGQGSQTGLQKKPPCSCSMSSARTASMQTSVKDIHPCADAAVSKDASSKEKLKSGEKVYCKCYPGRKKQRPKSSDRAENVSSSAPTDAATTDESKDAARPCQLSHSNITESLSQKYRGEILCIHNPPCVLINGCLNLPPTKEEMTMDTWPGTTSQAYRFCCSATNPYYYQSQPNNQYCIDTCQRNPYVIQDTACQYSSPIMDIRQNIKRSCSITKPATVIDNSCQYQPSSFELLNQKAAVNDSGRQGRISSNEIQKLKTINESCQYWLSPSEMDNSQNDIDETCFYCRESPTEIRKSHTYSKEKVRGIDIRLPKARKEKIMQSVCNHNPPCEIVRTCCKTPFDPKLQNSCVHVPMCKNLPLCVLEQKCQNEAFRSCQHRPKCVEVPICTRNYIALTAKEEIATQVQSKYKMVCGHQPPCVMVERCLARVCDSCLPCDPIPECVHQPMCEMIPACCRQPAKEMVSVHTQYPNQCSLV